MSPVHIVVEKTQELHSRQIHWADWPRSSLNPMADYTMLIIYGSLALGVSFLCSMLEAVLLSMSMSHVSIMSKTGDKNGVRWSRLKEDDSVKPLTAILTLNTIAHTMGAAGVGAEVSRIWGDDSLTVASIILTLAVSILIGNHSKNNRCSILEKIVTAFWLHIIRNDENACTFLRTVTYVQETITQSRVCICNER